VEIFEDQYKGNCLRACQKINANDAMIMYGRVDKPENLTGDNYSILWFQCNGKYM
jgi:hypothetical protein